MSLINRRQSVAHQPRLDRQAPSADCYDPSATPLALPARAAVTFRWQRRTLSPSPTDRNALPRAALGGGGPGGGPSPRLAGHQARRKARGAGGARCPAVRGECPAPAAAQVEARMPFALDGLPGSTPRRPRSVAGRGRAFGACCFAGKLRSPAGADPVPRWPRSLTPTSFPTSTPTSFPTRRGGVPLVSLAERI